MSSFSVSLSSPGSGSDRSGGMEIVIRRVMSTYFCPHSVFNSGYLIEFLCLKSDLIDNSNN